MEFKINPLDTLFFRDAKPFTMGEENWADSNFPPNPSVIYGALRTALATVKNKEISWYEIQDKLSTSSLKIQGLYYYLSTSEAKMPYFPLPNDFVEHKKNTEKQKLEKQNKEYEVKLLKPINKKSIISSKKKDILKVTFCSQNKEQVDELNNAFIKAIDLIQYLENEITTINARKLSDYVVSEAKIGNSRNNESLSVEEGNLYRIDMNRIKTDFKNSITSLELRVIFDLPNYEIADINGTLLRLGGESSLVQFASVGKNTLKIDVSKIVLKGEYFKMYLATPAIFNNGSFPDLEQWGIQATLVGACIGKVNSIGGYDILKNKPKNMYKVIPAGSIFIYHTNNISKISDLQGKSVSDLMSEQGYGIAYFGNFTWL